VLIDPAEFGTDREQVRLALEAVDIESRPTWKPMHLQPVFAGIGVVGSGYCEQIFDQGLCLPTGSALSETELARVVEVVLSQHCP
jgi:dTDP-4-amino-4,6-dideoxygalactose transaminase